jgi:hypothetical protein
LAQQLGRNPVNFSASVYAVTSVFVRLLARQLTTDNTAARTFTNRRRRLFRTHAQCVARSSKLTNTPTGEANVRLSIARMLAGRRLIANGSKSASNPDWSPVNGVSQFDTVNRLPDVRAFDRPSGDMMRHSISSGDLCASGLFAFRNAGTSDTALSILRTCAFCHGRLFACKRCNNTSL